MMKFNDMIWKHWEPGIVFLNKEKSLCFFKVTKNAGTSLVSMLGVKQYTLFKDIDSSDMIKFAVVRDPVTRTISGYQEICKLRKDEYPGYTRGLPFYKVKNQRKRFCQFLEDIRDNIYDTHIMPQVYQIHRPELVDYFLVFENLENDIKKFTEEYGLKLFTNIKLNLNKNENPGLRENLVKIIREDNGLKNMIIDMYREDFDLYNQVISKK